VSDRPNAINEGAGRLLVFLYGLFAVAAGARAGVQIGTKFDEAPLAYVLSAVAAAIYLVATFAFVRGGRGGRRLAIGCLVVELAGVLTVGFLSLLDRAAFPHSTVWSGFGSGYAFIPLGLPVIGLIWLRANPQTSPQPDQPIAR
jgi:hypothetical protein